MEYSIRSLLHVMVVAAVTSGAGAADKAPAPADILAAGRCDRACLHDLTDQVFLAMAAHDASRLPLRDGVRYTENGQALRLNDGLWQTADAETKEWFVGAVLFEFDEPGGARD